MTDAYVNDYENGLVKNWIFQIFYLRPLFS